MAKEEEEVVSLIIDTSKTNLIINKKQGDKIKELIQDNYDSTFPWYCRKVGIATPNFYSVLSGDRPCTLDWLNKLLSGIGYTAKINNEVIITENEAKIIVEDELTEPGIFNDYD